jgi:hypothetical protein
LTHGSLFPVRLLREPPGAWRRGPRDDPGRDRHAPDHVGTESPRPHVRYRGVSPLKGLAADASTRRRWAATQRTRTPHRKQGVSCFVLAILEGLTRTAMVIPCPWARASSPRPARSYEVQDLRWRNPAVTRTRLRFSTASHVELWEGHYMVRPEYHEYHARDTNLLAGSCWIPGSYTPRKGLKHLILHSFSQGCRLGRDPRGKPVKTTCYAKIDP